MRRSVRVAAAIVASSIALVACGKSSSGPTGGGASPTRSVIVLLPHGGLPQNAYDLGYQACTGKTPAEVAQEVGSTATDPAAVAAAFARDNFDAKARPFGTQGCLDGLEGRPEIPPSSSPSPTPTA
jgi:hypothetical protein